MSAAQVVHGAHRGRVSSTADPAGRRRLRLVIPDVFGSTPTGWAEPSTTRRAAGVPAVGDLVYVVFEAGCPEYPVWLDAAAGTTDTLAVHTGDPVTDTLAVHQGDLVLNVKNYGATGNGTTNDTTAVRAALTACPTDGSVYFPAGTYVVTATGTYTSALAPSKALTMWGRGATLLADPASPVGTRMVAPTASGLKVLGLGFNTNGISQATCVYLDTVSNVTVEGCQFTNPGSGGLLVNAAATDIRFCNNRASGVGYAVLVNDGAGIARLQINDNILTGSGDANCRDAVEINGVTNDIFDVETVGNVLSGYTPGNSITSGFGIAYSRVVRGVISGNSISGCGRNGIHLENLCSDVSVTGNSVTNCRHAGVEVQGESGMICKSILITGNTVSNCCTNPSLNLGNGGIEVGSSVSGVLVGFGAQTCVVSNNIVSGCQGNGIRLITLLNSTVVGNMVRSTYGLNTDTVHAVQNCGIYVISCNQTLVSSNRIADGQSTATQYYPIYVYGTATGSQFIGNMMTGNISSNLQNQSTDGGSVLQTGGIISVDRSSSVSKLGFFSATPVARPGSTPAAATDAATTQALVNVLRADLLALGLIA